MPVKKYKYTANVTQPQKVVDVVFERGEGFITEREYKALKKDAYGASLLEAGLIVVNPDPVSEPASNSSGSTEAHSEEVIPDFESGDGKGSEYRGGKGERDQDHAGWKPDKV